MVAFYNQEDQDIYKTNQFMPQSRFLLNAPKPVVEEEVTESFGIPQTQAFNNSGGNDFSVYNPDPNSIVNKNYNPRPYGAATGVEFPEPTGAAKIMGALSNFIPGKGIARFVGDYLPPNRRAIMENQLGNQGIMVNNIGQIVAANQGSAYDPSGVNVMAGYNANKITKDTFTKRRNAADPDLGGKMSKKGFKEFNKALTAAQERILGTATTQTDKIEEFEEEEKKLNKKNNFINKIFTKRKQKKADKIAAETEATAKAQAIADANKPYSGPTYRNEDGSAISQDFKNTTASLSNYDADVLYAKGGRVGYFFGGRVNYKAGGRTDAGPNRTTASKAGVGQINESGQKVSGGNYNNDGGNNSPFYGPKPTFFNNPEIISEKTILGNVPKGVAFNNDMGRYKAIMDLKNSIEKQGVEGEVEYNNSVGDFDLAAKYSTQDGTGYGVGYTGNNFDVNVDNQTGASANYSKDIFDGRGKITAGGTYNPDGTYNAEGKISFNYANGGLASIL